MSMSKTQLEQVKKQLLEQIENLPEDQKSSIKKQLTNLNDEDLEKFLIENKMIGNNSESNGQSPFRLIIEGKLPSFKIAENPLALATLEINPISKGHAVIIPKKPTKTTEIPEDIARFAQLLAQHLKDKLQCKDIQIGTMEMFGEAIINILPIYNSENFESKRTKASESELRELQEKLFLAPLENPSARPESPVETITEPEPEVIEEEKPKKKRKTPLKKLPKAPKRIP